MNAEQLRAEVVRLGLLRKGKNQYTQDAAKRLKVDGGYSDCSSFVRWCYLQATGEDIGANTVKQITNARLSEVCLSSSGQPADEGALLPGDLLFFKGTDASRPYKVGHVEMFISKNKLLGHGSGVGPTEKAMRTYCASRHSSGKGLIKVLRVIDAKATPLQLGDRTLKYGMAGADVRALQTALIALGYACGRWGADGEFGEATASALKAFQYDWHIEVDGIAGKHSYVALNAAIKELSDPPEGENAANAANEMIEVIGGTSYVRDQPGKHGRILGVVKTGDKLEYLGTKTDTWRLIAFAGERAWHSSRYGKVVSA